MLISRRFFTYPVLTSDQVVNTYRDKNFSLSLEKEEDASKVYLKNIVLNCDSACFEEQRDQGLVKIVLIVECPQTFFKQSYDITNIEDQIVLDKSDLSGKVEVCLIAYAVKDYVLRNDNELDEDYREIDFDLDKYQIIAYDNGFNFNVDHSDDCDTLAKSIFNVVIKMDSEDMTYRVDIQPNKIQISLSKSLHDKYRKVASIDKFAEEFFCVLLIPALIEGLNKCLTIANESSLDDINVVSDEFGWFRSVQESYLRLQGKELTLAEFKNISPIALAQMVLGNPLDRALDTIIERLKNEEHDDE